jgi:transposase
MTATATSDTVVRVTAGADTHRDTHMVAALDQRGGELGVRSFPTTPTGHRAVLAWLESFGPMERIGIEGTGTYGAGLTRFMHRHDIEVIEVSYGRPPGTTQPRQVRPRRCRRCGASRSVRQGHRPTQSANRQRGKPSG